MYDAVVVGVGGVGSFALRALAKQQPGGRFLGIERFARGHERGSSHGKTRIYRRAYFEHPNYVPWIEHSLSVFRELVQEYNVPLMQECGCLLIQPQEQQKMPPLLQASWESAQQHGIPVEFIGPTDLPERYPQFQYGSKNELNMVGLLEPGAGFLRPELCLETALRDAEESHHENTSVSILEHTKVLSFNEIPGSFPSSTYIELQIQSDNDGDMLSEPETITTRRLLLSTGSWTGQLLPAWAQHLRVIRQLQGWIDVASHTSSNNGSSNSMYSYQNMPAWVLDTPAWKKPLYGVPCDTDDPVTPHWLKVGIHGREKDVLNDPTTNPMDISVAEHHELSQAARHALARRPQQPQHNFVDIRPCLYTMTPDTDYMIGVPQGYSNVFAVAGLSGHGFKMTPTLGQMMADFCQDKDLSHWKMDFCSPRRFAV